MSVFNELFPKICEISKQYTKNFNDAFQAASQCIEQFEEEFQNGRNTRGKSKKDINRTTTLQSINEDDDEAVKSSSSNEPVDTKKTTNDEVQSLSDNSERRNSKKRSKNEVDGMSSPEQEKRQKRSASVKAQSNITKQVNVNLTQKLRRDGSIETSQSKGRRRAKEDDKENAEPIPIVQIKLEKISLPEPMDVESLSKVKVKKEIVDEVVMPPPSLPVPKSRKGITKEKSEESSEEESSSRRRTARKQTDTEPRSSTRSSRSRRPSRSTKQQDNDDMPPPEPRPKRTRAKKVTAETSSTEAETQQSQEPETAPVPDNPRPKRTRRAQKAAEKLGLEKAEETKEPESKQDEEESQTEVKSPVFQVKPSKAKNNEKIDCTIKDTIVSVQSSVQDTTRVLETNFNATVTLSSDMDKTMVLPNGVYNHAPISPKPLNTMNETVVLEKCSRDTMMLPKPQIMDATVVLDKGPANLTEDNSLLTDDSDCEGRPAIPAQEPTSAVKQKVQQFEELATRVTRTKTRAMTKKKEQPEAQNETQTPPDKVIKNVLSKDTLNKMSNMIFNGKTPHISSSASKLCENGQPTKSFIPSSSSKLSGINKAKEAEERQKKEKEDARCKKEALLEAKRELQKRKREEKMAAAAAAREAAERERQAQQKAAARDRQEKQAHADLGRQERLREAERKKQDLARKVAETEERRKAEEQARQHRLAEEMKRAEAARKKQIEEAEAMKKEAALMAKEIEKRQKEFLEKQKMKQRMGGDRITTPMKYLGTPGGIMYPPMEPVYMTDGFEFLNSDEDEEAAERPPPLWSTSKIRRRQLCVQARIAQVYVDRLFSVRAQTPDLREMFPDIERARLKRTSSAVWRTPPCNAK